MPNTHNVVAPEYMAMLGDAQPSYLFSGGAASVPVSSTTLAAFATTAYVNESNILYPVIQAAAAVGPLNSGNGTYWLAVHRSMTGAVASWTRQAGTHYLWRYDGSSPTAPQLEPLMPATPTGCLIFGRVTVVGGVITGYRRVARLRGTTGRRPFDPADFGFDPGASASVNTAALQAVADAQAALIKSVQPNFPNGVTTHTIPEIVIPDGYYEIDDEITFSGNAIIRGIGSPAIEQTTSGKGIFKFEDAYRVEVQGLKFIEGTRQISYLHDPSNDTSYLRVRDCEFQYARECAIWQLGTDGIDNPTASTTLTADATGGDTVISVASATGLNSNGDILLVNDLGEYHHTRYQSHSGTDITILYPVPAHWTGSAKASSGNAVQRGVFTQNSFTTVRDCMFMYVAKAIESAGETTTVDNCWVNINKLNFAALSPVFLSYGSRLNMTNLLGVAVIGTTYGVDRLAGVRWVDNYLYFSAKDCRFGGEDAGMVCCYNFGSYNGSSPYNGLNGIKIQDCELAFGLFGGPEGNHAAIYCAYGFPQRVHISGTRAYQRSNEWIVLSSGVNWTTYFSTAEAIAGVTFSIYLDDMEGEYAGIPTLPDALYRYLHVQPAPLVIGHLGTEPVPSPLEDRVYLWGSDINGAGTSGFTIMDEGANLYRMGPGIAGAGLYAPRLLTAASLATSSSGTTSIVDFTDLTLGALLPAGVWLLAMAGNPNGAGSASYRDTYLGVMSLSVGDNAGVMAYLDLTDLHAPALAGVADLTVTVHWWNGTTEVAGATGLGVTNTAYYLRVKVAGYAGTVGLSQIVSLTRLQ